MENNDSNVLTEFVVFNKYMGFEQLQFLKLKDVHCVSVTELNNINYCELLENPKKLWTIETALYNGFDYYLPEIHGVNGQDAIKWILSQSENETDYLYFFSPYLKKVKCGKIQIELNSTIIEGVVGDFYNLEHNDLDICMECCFDLCYKKIIDRGLFSDTEIFSLFDLSRKIKDIYLPELEKNKNLVYWINFAFGNFHDAEDAKTYSLFATGLRSKLVKVER